MFKTTYFNNSRYCLIAKDRFVIFFLGLILWLFCSLEINMVVDMLYHFVFYIILHFILKTKDMLKTNVHIAGLDCQKRACRSATATGKFNPETHVPTDEFYTFYEKLAKGSVGLLIMEHTFVELRGHADHP